MSAPISPQPGSASDPAHFVGRHRTTQRATRLLRDGTNLALTDPRRMGKTYWMRYFCATTRDYAVVQVDYEGVRSVRDFLLRTVQALVTTQSLPDRARRSLGAFFAGIEGIHIGPVSFRPGMGALPPARLLRETVLSVNEHATDRPILVCMDEVPVALRNIAMDEGPNAAAEVLQTLRALRQETSQIRWIVCGSVGFHHVLKLCKATEGDINDLETLPLGPLEPEEAEELAERLLLGIDRSADLGTVQILVESTGGVPFILHKVVSLLHDRGNGRVSPGDAARAFTDFVDDRDESRAVTHLVTRLEPYYGSQAILARKVLDETASGRHVTADLRALLANDEHVDDVLNDLIDDHYLREVGDTIGWRYEVLRYIWSRRRRLG